MADYDSLLCHPKYDDRPGHPQDDVMGQKNRESRDARRSQWPPGSFVRKYFDSGSRFRKSHIRINVFLTLTSYDSKKHGELDFVVQNRMKHRGR